MSATLFSEGHDLKAVIAQIDEQHAGAATVVSLSERRSRGVLGLLGRKSYAIEYEVDEPREETSPVELARRAHQEYERQTGGKRSPRPIRLAESADKSRHLQRVLNSETNTEPETATESPVTRMAKTSRAAESTPVTSTPAKNTPAKSTQVTSTPVRTALSHTKNAPAVSNDSPAGQTPRRSRGVTLSAPTTTAKPLIGKKSSTANAKPTESKPIAAKAAENKPTENTPTDVAGKSAPRTAAEANEATVEIARALAARKAAQIVAAEGRGLASPAGASVSKTRPTKRSVATAQPDFSGTLQAIAAARAAAAARRNAVPDRPAGRLNGKSTSAESAEAKKLDGASILESIARAAAQAAEVAAQTEAFVRSTPTQEVAETVPPVVVTEPAAIVDDSPATKHPNTPDVVAQDLAPATKQAVERQGVNRLDVKRQDVEHDEPMLVADPAPAAIAAPSHIPAEVTESVARQSTLQASVLAKALASAYKVSAPNLVAAAAPAAELPAAAVQSKDTSVRDTRTKSVRLPQALRLSRHHVKPSDAVTTSGTPRTSDAARTSDAQSVSATRPTGNEQTLALSDLLTADSGSVTHSDKSEVDVNRPAAQAVNAQPFQVQDFGADESMRAALREQARRAVEEAQALATAADTHAGRGSRRTARADRQPVIHEPVSRPSGTTADELATLGVSDKLIADVGQDDVFAALRSLTNRLRKAPALSTAPGEIVLLAGPLLQTVRAARTLASELRIDSSSIYVISSNPDFAAHGFGVSMDGKPLTPMSAASLVRAGLTAGLIVIDTDAEDTSALTSWSQGDDRSKITKLDSMIRAIEPQATWMVVDASRKFGDVESDLDLVPLVDALIVHSASHCTSPATVWGHKLPIALLDGRPSSANAWFALLVDRLDQQRQLTITRR